MPRSNRTPADYRRAELAKIHMAAKELGLDRDTYEDVLWTVARVRSAADLDSTGRFKVIAHFKALGWKPKGGRKWGRKPNVTGDKTALMGKLEALLADNKLPWSYADGMSKRMFKVDKVAWVSQPQLRKLVAALQISVNRKKAKASTTESTEGKQ